MDIVENSGKKFKSQIELLPFVSKLRTGLDAIKGCTNGKTHKTVVRLNENKEHLVVVRMKRII